MLPSSPLKCNMSLLKQGSESQVPILDILIAWQVPSPAVRQTGPEGWHVPQVGLAALEDGCNTVVAWKEGLGQSALVLEWIISF